MDSREEILANFQACTGIDDVEVAICQLEESGWVLVDAVNKALPSSPPAAPAPAAAPAAPPPVSLPQAAAAPVIPPFEPHPTRTPPTSRHSPPINIDDGEDVVGPAAMSMRNVGIAAGPSSGFAGFRNGGSVTIANDLFGGPSTSSRMRMLDFYITHHDVTFHLKVPDNEDVKTLKSLIQAETGFPPCQQSLHGLRPGAGSMPSSFVSDRRRLSELHLPKENFIHLLTPEVANDEENNGEETPEVPGDFKLNIKDESDPEKKVYNLNFRPTHTVLGVKLDVSALVNIPVSKQLWRGWPNEVNDDTAAASSASNELSLAQLGIPNRLELSVDRKPDGTNGEQQAGGSGSRDVPVVLDDAPTPSTSSSNRPTNSRPSRPRGDDVTMDSDASESDDFEDASEVMLLDDDDWKGAGAAKGAATSRRLQPLIPDDYGDECMAAIKFSEEFAARYGSPHPVFFPGSLDDAIKESCMKSPKERKMLAIYLHHDSSVLTNVFCAQALCADSVVSFLNENFVNFGWDLSFSSNKKRLLKMVTDHFGSVAAATIRNLDIEKLPLIALVYRLRGSTEIFQIIHGNVTLDELMGSLLSAHDTYTSQLAVELEEERAREARNAVKMEQDLAFEMAQQEDREREMKKQREEEERKEQERLAEAIRKSEEEAANVAAAEKEKRRLEVFERLPEEPSKDVKHARIRFRAGGADSDPKTFERRFLPSDALQVILDFLVVEGYDMNEHKLISSWPRRDLTTLDTSETLEALKLYPQETLIVEER